MPTYRPVISREELQQLEHYLFALTRFVDTADFQKDTSSQKQQKVINEMGYITMAIDILKKTFVGTGCEKPIVGWEIKNPDKEFGFMRVWYFSSSAAAGRILNINKSHISAVCRGGRKSAGGWIFKLQSDYEEEERQNFNSESPRFDIINIDNGKN